MKLNNKKAISGIVVISLLLIMSVSAGIYLQKWFLEYNSSFQTDILNKKNLNNNLEVLKIENTYLTLKNDYKNDLNISSIKIGDKVCNVTYPNVDLGVFKINISDCTMDLVEVKPYDVAIITTEGVANSYELVKDPYKCVNNLISPVYNITNCCELQSMEYDKTGSYQLMNNLDCSDTVNWNSGTGFTSITFSPDFTGSLNGKGYTINNFYSNWSSVFRNTNGAIIENINFDNFNDTNSGGLIDYATNTIVNNVIINGDINCNSGDDIGGIVGVVSDFTTIKKSSFNGNINCPNSNYVGGIVGRVTSSSNLILNSHSSGTINGQSDVGGIVGRFWTGTMDINNSYSSANINGANNVGGIVGHLGQSNIINSYSSGNITATSDYLGGLIGYVQSDANITNSYSVSKIINLSSASNMGGVTGFISAGYYDPLCPCSVTINLTVNNTFWDNETSGISTSIGASIGKTTTQMKNASTFSTWDTNIWNILDGSYPTLK